MDGFKGLSLVSSAEKVIITFQGDDIIIDTQQNDEISDSLMTSIAETILGWFCNGELKHSEFVSDFKASVLATMPPEGGIIPLDNIVDWIESLDNTILKFFTAQLSLLRNDTLKIELTA
jgi:hypothetical protein